MPPAQSSRPVCFIFGEDEYAVKQQAKKVFQKWSEEIGGMDHEMIDAAVSNAGEALRAISRLREGLNTLPFFGTGKVVWFQNCSFLGDDRTATSSAVTEALAEMAAELKVFEWRTVRLIVSAGKVDKRKVFYKAMEKIGDLKPFEGLSIEDRDWADQAESIAEGHIRESGKSISPQALAELVALVGPNSRQLASEAEKLIVYTGDRSKIEVGDVEAVVSKNKMSRAFALGDALGERNLVKLLRVLDEELWSMKVDSQKSEIGTLYGLISKIRSMILVKELAREGLLKPAQSSQAVQSQLLKIPAGRLPEDRRYNPAALHPFVVMKSLQHSDNYSMPELIQAMDLLLQCNRKLVSSGISDALILQSTLVEIVGTATPGRRVHAA